MTAVRVMQGIEQPALWEQVAALVTGGSEQAPAGQVLKSGRRRRTMRLCLGDGTPVIVKTWTRSKYSVGFYRVAFPWTTAYREWHTPRLLERCGVQTSCSLAYFNFIQPDGLFGEAVVLKDLGQCGSPMRHAKQLLAVGDEAGLAGFEDEVIEITARFVENGFLDRDHRLVNFAMTPEGELIRLDFEHCRRYGQRLARWMSGSYAMMLATVISTYAFTVQPQTQRAEGFAERLAERLRPPRRVLRRAGVELDRMFDRQQRSKGIDTRLTLRW